MKDLADSLFEMRKNGKPINKTIKPESILEAYKIQQLNAAKEGKKIKAWKLGGATQNNRTAFKTHCVFYGPIFHQSVFSYHENINLKPSMSKVKGELELSFKLSSAIKNLTLTKLQKNEIHRFVSSCYASVEIPWSVFPFPESGLPLLIADYCASGALILGNEILWNKDSQKSLRENVSMKTHKDFIAKGSLKNILGNPLLVLKDFLELAIKHQVPLEEGQLVCTGGASDCVLLPQDIEIKVTFEGLDQFSFKLENI